MGYAQLFESKKSLTVSNVKIVIRKTSYGERQRLNLFTMDTRELEFGSDGRATKVLSIGSIEKFNKVVKETLLNCIVSWDLKNSDTQEIVPVSEEVISDLIANEADFINLIYSEVELFNAGIDLDIEKKS